MELSLKHDVNSYFYYNLSDGENIGLYLDKPANRVSKKDIMSEELNNSIIFTKKRRIDNDAELKQCLEDKQIWEVGDMYLILLEN